MRKCNIEVCALHVKKMHSVEAKLYIKTWYIKSMLAFAKLLLRNSYLSMIFHLKKIIPSMQSNRKKRVLQFGASTRLKASMTGIWVSLRRLSTLITTSITLISQ